MRVSSTTGSPAGHTAIRRKQHDVELVRRVDQKKQPTAEKNQHAPNSLADRLLPILASQFATVFAPRLPDNRHRESPYAQWKQPEAGRDAPVAFSQPLSSEGLGWVT
jgi:hypothetical protein